MRVLVVDDSPEIVKILACNMELSGYSVDEAYDGMEAIEFLRKKKYDVVVTDAEMPRMSGIGVVKYLKARFPDVFVIGMSGSLNALKAFRDVGADICFAKPFNVGKVEQAIENRFQPPLFAFNRAVSY